MGPASFLAVIKRCSRKVPTLTIASVLVLLLPWSAASFVGAPAPELAPQETPSATLPSFSPPSPVAPEVVADAVVHALQSRWPKTRYLVGSDAKVRAVISRLLPDRLMDALVRSAVGRMERQVA